jgi:hypothetical protein
MKHRATLSNSSASPGTDLFNLVLGLLLVATEFLLSHLSMPRLLKSVPLGILKFSFGVRILIVGYCLHDTCLVLSLFVSLLVLTL